jgi:hypothetical protein
LIDEVIADKPAAPGLKPGDRIIAIGDGSPVSSPGDARQTNAKPAAPLVFRIARDGAEDSTRPSPRKPWSRADDVGVAGVRLKDRPGHGVATRGDGALWNRRSGRAGRAQDVGTLGVHAEMLGRDADR